MLKETRYINAYHKLEGGVGWGCGVYKSTYYFIIRWTEEERGRDKCGCVKNTYYCLPRGAGRGWGMRSV